MKEAEKTLTGEKALRDQDSRREKVTINIVFKFVKIVVDREARRDCRRK